MMAPKNLLITAIALLVAACSQQAPENALKVDTSKPVSQNIQGMGVQWSAYPHADSKNSDWGDLVDEADWNKLYDRLDYMQPKLFRVMDQAGWRYFKGVDENNQPITDFDTPEIHTLYKILDYAEENDVTVYFGEWGAPAFWGEEGQIERADDPRWINMIGAYLEHLIVDKGYTCLKYYTLVNEPNGNWASTDGNFEEWASGVRKLQAELVRRGLDDKISLASPDAVPQYNHPDSPMTGMDWVLQSVKQLDDIIGSYEVHYYASGTEVRSGKLTDSYRMVEEFTRDTGKPLVLGELGLKYHGEMGKENRRRAEADPHAGPGDSQMFVYDPIYAIDVSDALIQALKTGFQGAIAWDLDDAMHTVGDNGGRNNLKRWGMWNILGKELFNDPDDETPRPWYYSWSLMSRNFTRGAEIFDTNDDNYANLRAVAGYSKSESKFSLAMVNRSDSSRSVPVQVPKMEGLQAGQYNIYQMTADTLAYTEKSKAVPKRTVETGPGQFVELVLPANSFTLVVND